MDILAIRHVATGATVMLPMREPVSYWTTGPGSCDCVRRLRFLHHWPVTHPRVLTMATHASCTIGQYAVAVFPERKVAS